MSHKQTICPNICVKPLPKNALSPLLVDARRSKTPLLKLAAPHVRTEIITLVYFLGGRMSLTPSRLFALVNF